MRYFRLFFIFFPVLLFGQMGTQMEVAEDSLPGTAEPDTIVPMAIEEENITMEGFVPTDSIRMGDTLVFTLRVKIEGAPYLYDMEEPRLNLTNLKMVGSGSANRSEEGFSVVEYNFFLMPNTLGMAYIEPVKLDYTYKPQDKTGELTTSRFAITVLERIEKGTNRNTWIFIAAVVLVLIGGTLTWILYRTKKNEVPVEIERPSVEERLQKKLKAAEESASKGDYDQFFLITERILSEYLQEKSGLRIIGASIEDIESELYNMGFSSVVVKGIKKGIEQGRLVRFGKGKVDNEVLQEIMRSYAALLEGSKEENYGESSTPGDTEQD